ncbi:MAG: NADH-ubiquinone oxidoreductase-F iron-sulfur binding region domain-containing protein [Sciscionella sp.]
MSQGAERILPLTEPVGSVAEYVATGGGSGFAAAARRTPESVIEEVRAAGLRGRGGAGLPTAHKWADARRGQPGFLVCNAVAGEPGSFKDRCILRRDPYQVLEGMAIAAHALGVTRSYVAIKKEYRREILVLRGALREMAEASLLGPASVQLVLGPDEYLFGEEQGAAAVVQGGRPLPLALPVQRVGVGDPAVVHNVETLAHLPGILRQGAAWFRVSGTETSPGTTVFTLSGDVRRPGVYELPLGITVRMLVDVVGGGPASGGRCKAVVPGASGALLTEEKLDTPLDFDSMAGIGSCLGSSGLVVYDDSACMVAVTLAFARFLAIESCGQCAACGDGNWLITECLERIECGDGSARDIDAVLAACAKVTDGQRCLLPTGAASLVRSAVESFAAEFIAHLGRCCPRPRLLPVPKIVDFDERSGQFSYDERYELQRPDRGYLAEIGGEHHNGAPPGSTVDLPTLDTCHGDTMEEET